MKKKKNPSNSQCTSRHTSKYIPKYIFKYIVMVMLLAVSVSPLLAQYEFYYGKNKVLDKKFNWQFIETPNFKIYYYITDEVLVKRIAAASEYSYKKISDYLGVKVEKKIPVIFFPTRFDFERTNIIGYVPAGAQAFAESTHYRVVIQGESSFEELARTITHELGHIFEYTIMGQRRRFIPPPLWVTEGFSEFITGNWGQFYLLTVRDMVLTGRVPQITKFGDLRTPYYNSRTIPYDFGHIIFEFLDEKLGKRGVKKLLYSLRGGSLLKYRGGNILKVLDYTAKLFNHEFGKYLRQRFKKYMFKEDPEDYSYMVGPDFPFFYSFSHQVSPSGELLAVLTVNAREGDLDIILISMKDGKVIKNLTPGFTSKYDYINFQFDPTDGISFTWNKESDTIAFFARREWHNYLVLVDVLSGRITKQIKIKTIQNPSSPVFAPGDEGRIFFSAQEATRSYIYSMDLATGKTSRHTDGLLFIKALNIAPDGKRLVFSAKTEHRDYYKLYMAILDNPDMARQLTFGDYNDITPVFSADSRYLYYSSDELESYNINSIDLEENKLHRFTDVKTGNFFPIEIPGEEREVVMTSFYKGSFSLFRKKLTDPLETRDTQFENLDRELLARQDKEAVEERVEDTEIKFMGKYKPFSKLFIHSLPPLAVSVGTDGGMWGYSSLTLTDLMGDHFFTFLASSFYGYRSYHMVYLNQGRRLQLFAHLYAYKELYFYNYEYPYIYDARNLRTLRAMYGGEFGVYYPFNRSYRAEATVSMYNQEENFDSVFLGTELPFGQFFSGIAMPFRLSLVGETTRFQYYGPNMGHSFKLSFEKYVKVGSDFLDAYAVEVDLRKYIRLDNHTLLAFRLSGFKSGGDNSLLYWTGGNNTIRSAEFRRLVGNNIAIFNAEFRFPVFQQVYSFIGPLGPIRGVFFFDLGAIWFNDQDFRFFEEGEGMKLQDAIASYGFGIEFFMFGYPMHLDWVWRTDLRSRDYHGVNFWIGFDF